MMRMMTGTSSPKSTIEKKVGDMMLSKSQIKAALANREIVIEPFDESRLTPNGYILTMDKITIPSMHWTVKTGFVAVGKQTSFQVTTKEHIHIGDDLTGELTLCSELSAKGILASFPRLDAGYRGKVVLSAFNSSIRTIDIDTGEPIAEVIFERITEVDGGARFTDAKAPLAVVSETATSRPSAPAPPPLAAVTKDTALGTRLDPRDGGMPCFRNKCTACCHDTEMPLTNEDRARIESLGFTDFYHEDDDWFILKNLDGKCVFLQDDGKCKIYTDHPTGCSFYPAVWSMDDQAPIMDHDCPYSSEFFITDTLSKDLKNLVDTVQRERKQRRFRKGAL